MNKRIMAYASISLLLSYSLTACGGGGSSSSDVGLAGKPGFSVPTEISAVPTNSSATGNSKPSNKSSFKSQLLAVKQAATDAGTDYSTTPSTKFVEENALDQFGIIESIMKSLAQTRYADAENINNGPYKAMVTQPGNNKGAASKVLQPWVVDSKLITENGKEVNVVQVWIEETDDSGQPRPVKAEFKISASATKKADGSYQDYGVWTLNAGLGESDNFAASASVGANGEAILKIHETASASGGGNGGGGTPFETKGILNKSDTSGFGRVQFPEFGNCDQNGCTMTPTDVSYVYDAAHLAVKAGSDPTEFKDRTNVIDMTHRYGMFEADTGKDVLKTHSFGFPVEYTVNGVRQFAYYGAWQGQHQLWANGGTVPAGTTVTRADRNSNQAVESYTVSAPVAGTLVKRTLVGGSINDIKNIPVEIFVNIGYQLQWNGSQWVNCVNPNFGTFPPTCGAGSGPITDFGFLVANPADTRKFIMINRWVNNQETDYVYDPNGSSGAGFYVATRNQQNNSLTSTGVLYTPASGDQLFANIGGSIYIMYNGNSWVEKILASFDQSTWTPTFAPADQDKPYTLDLNREYYINNQGVNYVVKRTDTATYDVQTELQSVANPVNVSTFLQANTIFKPQWDSTGNSTYQFITDPASPKFLKLVYASVGANDPTANVGDLVTQGQWGLVAWVGGTNTGVQFNWNYPREGENFGTLTYLIKGDGTYKLLDDPIRLSPITLTNNGGETRTVALQYDGWMQGLPDLYQELQKNNFKMSDDISDKIINIPAGTDVVDAQGKHYLIKPLETSQFLTALSSDPGDLDLILANTLDLSTVPTFVAPTMGAEPSVSTIKYTEGKLVE